MTGDGWKPLIDPLIEQANREGAKIAQIKEKFGGLRFYVSNASAKLNSMIDMAERQSFHICERCGKEGKLRTDRSWLKTLCEECNVS